MLSGCYCSYLFVKDNLYFIAFGVDCTRLFDLSVTGFGFASELVLRLIKCYPVQIIRIQRIGKQKLVCAKRYDIIIGIFTSVFRNLRRYLYADR